MKKFTIFLIAFITTLSAAALIVGCNENPTVETIITPTSIELSRTELTLDVGESFTLTATIKPENAEDKSVIWTSSSDDVATVADGVIYAAKEGPATIVASTANGITAACALTVKQVFVFEGDETGYTIKQYTGNGPVVNIPSFYNDGPITSIGNGAFGYCIELTSIVIPDSVTSIGNLAFSNCSSLTSVVIPDSVTSIDSYAFYGCSELTSIVIPDSVTSIGDRAFYGCSGLTSVTIGNSVTSIGSSAFGYCSELTSIVIPDSVTSIGEAAFSNCTKLTSATIGNGVTVIINHLFYYCGLTSIVIPEGVTYIGNNSFYSCINLTSIVIPSSVWGISSNAFYYCIGLSSVEYEGTKEQWKEILKGSGWKEYVRPDCIVHCSDGDISIND